MTVAQTMGVMRQIDPNDALELKVLFISLRHFSQKIKFPSCGLPLLLYVKSISRAIFEKASPQRKPINWISQVYKREIKEAGDLQIPEWNFLSALFGEISAAFKGVERLSEPLLGIKKKIPSDRSKLIISIARRLQESGKKKALVSFLYYLDILEFKKSALRNLLISVLYENLRSSDEPFIQSREFPGFVKKILYSYSWNPESLKFLIQGGTRNGHFIAPLLQTQGPEIFRCTLSYLLSLYKTTLPPPESKKLVQDFKDGAPPIRRKRPRPPPLQNFCGQVLAPIPARVVQLRLEEEPIPFFPLPSPDFLAPDSQ
ncbi:MAG: hypothetical protein A3E80_06235 [Chlamydiae bacterium RIFCSPHIGHO2_12_FULL_49_9]|nr:MAG: hypothetical protein A3E80_06235 [Chlamydiae bacterium RIFCSPHIGHO2_12_FULL_49_9]